MRVVFTGQAVDNSGNAILRANLIKACEHKGIAVHTSMSAQVDWLVASRKDTTKAKKAQALGANVMTYPEFLSAYLRDVTIPTSGKFNPYTDRSKVDHDSLVPCFLVGPDFKNLDLL